MQLETGVPATLDTLGHYLLPAQPSGIDTVAMTPEAVAKEQAKASYPKGKGKNWPLIKVANNSLSSLRTSGNSVYNLELTRRAHFF